MIVRIPGRGQYRLPGAVLDDLNEIDNGIVDAVAVHDVPKLHKLLGNMHAVVTESGEPLDVDELVESDIILPDVDISLEQAGHMFVGEGLVPG